VAYPQLEVSGSKAYLEIDPEFTLSICTWTMTLKLSFLGEPLQPLVLQLKKVLSFRIQNSALIHMCVVFFLCPWAPQGKDCLPLLINAWPGRCPTDVY
jgi:hypothetical protein